MINQLSQIHPLIVALFLSVSIANLTFAAPEEDRWIRVDNGDVAFSTNLGESEALELERSIRLFSPRLAKLFCQLGRIIRYH